MDACFMVATAREWRSEPKSNVDQNFSGSRDVIHQACLCYGGAPEGMSSSISEIRDCSK